MGVYIKGMEMPKDGCHHMICIYADGTVPTGGRVYMAVPVPPHGRLIDADAALRDGWTISRTYSASQTEMVCEVKAIDYLPTIIPASEEGET